MKIDSDNTLLKEQRSTDPKIFLDNFNRLIRKVNRLCSAGFDDNYFKLNSVGSGTNPTVTLRDRPRSGSGGLDLFRCPFGLCAIELIDDKPFVKVNGGFVCFGGRVPVLSSGPSHVYAGVPGYLGYTYVDVMGGSIDEPNYICVKYSVQSHTAEISPITLDSMPSSNSSEYWVTLYSVYREGLNIFFPPQFVYHVGNIEIPGMYASI